MADAHSHTSSTSPKRYKVTAIIKYHVDIGVFEAPNKEVALNLAMETTEWYRASQKPGGVWDTKIEALTDEQQS